MTGALGHHRLSGRNCKLNDVDPLAYLTDALTRIVNGHPNSDIDQLLPWPIAVTTSKLWPENSAYV
jgi:hypothetical protein